MLTYKLVRADYLDLWSGTLAYSVGATILPLNAVCESKDIAEAGIHSCTTIRDALIKARNLGRSYESRPWRVLEMEVAEADVVARDGARIRARKAMVVREIPLADAINSVLPGWADRLERSRAVVANVKDVTWGAPEREVAQLEVSAILAKWHDAITPFLRGRPVPPRAARIVTDPKLFRKYAAADADAADADADAAAAAAAAADAAAAAAAADAAAAAADAADAAAAADAADAAAGFYYWRRWYCRPQVYRLHRWAMAGMDPEKNPARWIMELWRLGLIPIGYVRDDGEVFFAIYHPPVVAKVEAVAA